MRTHPDFLRKGVGQAILEQIIATARERGVGRLSLETGSGPDFEAALAMYRRRGFVNGEPFSDYTASAFNQFLHLDLWRSAAQAEQAQDDEGRYDDGGAEQDIAEYAVDRAKSHVPKSNKEVLMP